MERRRLRGERADRRRMAVVEEIFWQAEGKTSSFEDVGKLEKSTMLTVSGTSVVLKTQWIDDGYGRATISHTAEFCEDRLKGYYTVGWRYQQQVTQCKVDERDGVGIIAWRTRGESQSGELESLGEDG